MWSSTPEAAAATGANDELFFRAFGIPLRGMECICTSKHRRLGTNGSLLGGTPPKTPLERMEIFMELLFFIIGFLLGSLGGVTTMCLVQINRIGKEDGHGQAEHRD